MSRSIEKVGRQIRRRVTAIEKSLDRMKPGKMWVSRVKIAGAAAAFLAGAAAVVHYVRARGRGAAQLHVRHDGARWAVRTGVSNGAAKTFDTKRQAVAAAREEAAAAAPSELVIHLADGSVERSHSYDLD